MSQFKLCEENFDSLFQRWIEENALDKRSIAVTTHIPKGVVFGSYDAWKTASRDDYCEEKSYSKTHYMDEFYDTAHSCFEEELLGEEFESEEEAYKEFSFSMFMALECWEKNYEENQER